MKKTKDCLHLQWESFPYLVVSKIIYLGTKTKYSWDLNKGNIWIVNFLLSGIQMVVWYSDHHSDTGPVFKWRSEYLTKFSLVFKWHTNNGPFGDWTNLDQLNTRLVGYSDPTVQYREKQWSESQTLSNKNEEHFKAPWKSDFPKAR